MVLAAASDTDNLRDARAPEKKDCDGFSARCSSNDLLQLRTLPLSEHGERSAAVVPTVPTTVHAVPVAVLTVPTAAPAVGRAALDEMARRIGAFRSETMVADTVATMPSEARRKSTCGCLAVATPSEGMAALLCPDDVKWISALAFVEDACTVAAFVIVMGFAQAAPPEGAVMLFVEETCGTAPKTFGVMSAKSGFPPWVPT